MAITATATAAQAALLASLISHPSVVFDSSGLQRFPTKRQQLIFS
jgi:hypothetical protein